MSRFFINWIFLKFAINGLFATFIHYSILTFNIYVIKIKYVGISNGIAAIFGITASFIGNKYFVFKDKNKYLLKQFKKFFLIYSLLLFYHTLFLFIWSDFFKFNYNIGFMIATSTQFLLSFLGNKLLVFKLN